VCASADMNSASRQRFFQAAWLFNNVEQRGIVGEHSEYGRPVVGGVFYRCHRLGAEVQQRLQFLCGPIINANLVPSAQKTLRHSLTHTPKPDKTDLHKRLLQVNPRGGTAQGVSPCHPPTADEQDVFSIKLDLDLM
jgi:hypothetical protein